CSESLDRAAHQGAEQPGVECEARAVASEQQGALAEGIEGHRMTEAGGRAGDRGDLGPGVAVPFPGVRHAELWQNSPGASEEHGTPPRSVVGHGMIEPRRWAWSHALAPVGPVPLPGIAQHVDAANIAVTTKQHDTLTRAVVDQSKLRATRRARGRHA